MQSSQNFTIYLVGFIILVAGLAYGAHLAGVPPHWIIVGVICLVGIGILSAVKKTQSPAVPRDDQTPRQPPPR
ncbi:MAG TPA: hypothetical protein VHM02_12235 [Thermoanaerobaculia bacterium]|nr:hypothetical protein [Thermoanaerobaculia bacterium]